MKNLVKYKLFESDMEAHPISSIVHDFNNLDFHRLKMLEDFGILIRKKVTRFGKGAISFEVFKETDSNQSSPFSEIISALFNSKNTSLDYRSKNFRFVSMDPGTLTFIPTGDSAHNPAKDPYTFYMEEKTKQQAVEKIQNIVLDQYSKFEIGSIITINDDHMPIKIKDPQKIQALNVIFNFALNDAKKNHNVGSLRNPIEFPEFWEIVKRSPESFIAVSSVARKIFPEIWKKLGLDSEFDTAADLGDLGF